MKPVAVKRVAVMRAAALLHTHLNTLSLQVHRVMALQALFACSTWGAVLGYKVTSMRSVAWFNCLLRRGCNATTGCKKEMF